MTAPLLSMVDALVLLSSLPSLCILNPESPKHCGPFSFRLLWIVRVRLLGNVIVDLTGSLIGRLCEVLADLTVLCMHVFCSSHLYLCLYGTTCRIINKKKHSKLFLETSSSIYPQETISNKYLWCQSLAQPAGIFLESTNYLPRIRIYWLERVDRKRPTTIVDKANINSIPSFVRLQSTASNTGLSNGLGFILISFTGIRIVQLFRIFCRWIGRHSLHALVGLEGQTDRLFPVSFVELAFFCLNIRIYLCPVGMLIAGHGSSEGCLFIFRVLLLRRVVRDFATLFGFDHLFKGWDSQLGIVVPMSGLFIGLPIDLVRVSTDMVRSFTASRQLRRAADMVRPLWRGNALITANHCARRPR